MYTIADILSISGIVVRNIPPESISLWTYREGAEVHLKDNEKIVVKRGRKYVQETKVNALSGYAVTRCMGQGSQVTFSRKMDGFGSTIESAYADFIEKNPES